MGRSWLLLGAAVAALASCREPTAPRAAVTLHLDRDGYVATPIGTDPARYAFRVVVRYENMTDSSIWFEKCMPGDRTPIFSVPTTDGSDSGYDIGWGCVGMPPVEFPPGAARTDTLLVQGPNVFDHSTHKPFGVIAGYFRLEYFTLKCDTSCYGAGPRVASAAFWVWPL